MKRLLFVFKFLNRSKEITPVNFLLFIPSPAVDFLVGERMDGCSLCSGRSMRGGRSSRDKLNNSLTLSFSVGERTDDCSGRRQILSKLNYSLTGGEFG